MQSPAPLWNVLQQPGVFMLGARPVFVAYPVMAWIAVMAAGYCLGPVFLKEQGPRRRTMIVSGLMLIAAFIVFRSINGYGDPSPWSVQGSAAMTMVSFLRTTKYPPSLMFLLMTLGPALLVMAWLDKRRLRPWHHIIGKSSSHGHALGVMESGMKADGTVETLSAPA